MVLSLQGQFNSDSRVTWDIVQEYLIEDQRNPKSLTLKTLESYCLMMDLDSYLDSIEARFVFIITASVMLGSPRGNTSVRISSP